MSVLNPLSLVFSGVSLDLLSTAMSWLTNVDTSNGPADVEIVPVEVAILTPG